MPRTYKCSFCKAEYATQAEAAKCLKSHKPLPLPIPEPRKPVDGR